MRKLQFREVMYLTQGHTASESCWSQDLNSGFPESITTRTLLTIFLFFFGYTVWHAGSWFPDQGLNPCPPAVEARSPNHWTAREFPLLTFWFWMCIWEFGGGGVGAFIIQQWLPLSFSLSWKYYWDNYIDSHVVVIHPFFSDSPLFTCIRVYLVLYNFITCR